MMTSFLSCNKYTKLHISSWFLYVCMKLCLHINYLHHFYICLFGIFLYVIFHFFHFYFCIFLRKFRLNYTYELHTHTLFIIVSYFVNMFYCRNFMFLHGKFLVFQLTFSCFHYNVCLYTFTW